MKDYWEDPLLNKLIGKYVNPLEEREDFKFVVWQDINMLKAYYLRTMSFMAMRDVPMSRKENVEVFLQQSPYAEEDFIKEVLNAIQSIKIRCAIY